MSDTALAQSRIEELINLARNLEIIETRCELGFIIDCSNLAKKIVEDEELLFILKELAKNKVRIEISTYNRSLGITAGGKFNIPLGTKTDDIRKYLNIRPVKK